MENPLKVPPKHQGEPRCDKCNNRVDAIWSFCPWCGSASSWDDRRPGPQRLQPMKDDRRDSVGGVAGSDRPRQPDD
jgi:hypothetical protein